MNFKIKAATTLFLTLTLSFVFFLKKESNSLPLDRPIFSGAPMSTSSNQNRLEFEHQRLQDPNTGEIPKNIRIKELKFAQAIPHSETKNNNNWTNIGPYNIGGRTRALAIDRTNENKMFAGGASGGLWMSLNGGSSWNQVPLPVLHLSVTCITQDPRPTKDTVWYIGTGEATGSSATGGGSAFYLGNGLMKSSDGGLTWKSISSTLDASPQNFSSFWEAIWNIKVHPTDTADVLYAATIARVYRSVNGGVSWTTARGGNSQFSTSYFTDVDITSTGTMYATLSSDGPQKGIWRAPDIDNSNWINITPDSFPSNYNRIVTGIDPNNENNVYFLANTPNGGKETQIFFGGTEWNSLWKYTYLSGDGSDSGGVWVNLSDNLPAAGLGFDNFNAQGSYNLLVRVKPGSSSTVFIGGTNLYRSTDGFTTVNNTAQVGGYQESTIWPHFDIYKEHHPDQHELVFLPSDPDVMFSGTDGGVFRCDDNTSSTISWNSLNNGYITTQLYAVAIDHATSGSNQISGGFQDYGSWFTNSSNPQATWTFPSTGDGAYCAIENGGNTHYYSRQNGHVVKVKLDANGNATDFNRIDPIGGKDYQFINPFILDPQDNNVMYLAGGNTVWRNSDLSQINYDNNYDSISTNWMPFTDSLALNLTITALAATESTTRRLYIGTNNRRLYKYENANTGNPAKVDITGPWGSSNINCIAVDPRDDDKLMIVLSNYSVYSLYYSEDAGANWIKVAGNLEQFPSGGGTGPSLRWASILPVSNGTVYLVGGSTGLYGTDKLIADSTVWFHQGVNSIKNAVVDMIKTRESDGYVVVGTHGNGIFTDFYEHPWDVNGEKELFDKPSVHLYPNPAAEIIQLNNFSNDPINLEVYSLNGSLVLTKTILNKTIDVSQLKAGVYFFKIKTKEAEFIKKIVIQ